MNERLKMLVASAISAAIIAVLAQITIPLPLVPITGQTLAVLLVATILGARYGTISISLYILLGIIGVPVFSGFSSGIGVLLGPTGGYIFAYILAAFISGGYIEKVKLSYFHATVANIIGAMIILAIGTIQLKYVANLSWQAALISGAYPFIVGEIFKAVVAAWIGVKVKKQLYAARFFPEKISM